MCERDANEYRMDDIFGVTEMAKLHGDEEHGHEPRSMEKEPTDELYETTTTEKLAVVETAPTPAAEPTIKPVKDDKELKI